MKIWMTGLLTILLTVLFNYNAEAKGGCGCRTRSHNTYGYHRGYRHATVRHTYYRPLYGYRHTTYRPFYGYSGRLHAKKYKMKVKYE